MKIGSCVILLFLFLKWTFADRLRTPLALDHPGTAVLLFYVHNILFQHHGETDKNKISLTFSESTSTFIFSFSLHCADDRTPCGYRCLSGPNSMCSVIPNNHLFSCFSIFGSYCHHLTASFCSHCLFASFCSHLQLKRIRVASLQRIQTSK